MIHKYIGTAVFCLLTLPVMAQYTIKGRVASDTEKAPLPGASVILKGTQTGTITDHKGEFLLNIPVSGNSILVISYIGYKSVEFDIAPDSLKPVEILLSDDYETLEAVYVSTGYERIPEERKTGSIFLVDNQLLNRRIGMNILERIEDLVPGLSFHRGGTGRNNQELSIRGESTIFANARPLIILDNFPYEGDLGSINPADVESITVLKDAAAASIWGARAGNGVIVITTKNGKFNSPLQVSLTANTTFSDKPDLYYHPQMPTGDYISLEQRLFSEGYFSSSEASLSKVALSPVTELLIAHRDGILSEGQLSSQLDKLKNQDTRTDIEKYFFQTGVLNQLSVNLNGGSNQYRYRISLGQDNSTLSAVGNKLKRTSLTTAHTFKIGKIEGATSLFFTSINNQKNAVGASTSYPYQMLVDEDGKSLNVTKDLRDSFKEQAARNGLLDWQYRPFDEQGLMDHRAITNEYRINSSLRYSLTPLLNLELRYQHGKIMTQDRNNQSVDSYEVRYLINRYSAISPANGVVRPIPLGGILDLSGSEQLSNNGRIQLSYENKWGAHNSLSAIGGSEIMELVNKGSSYRYYGYRPEQATIQYVDYLTLFPYFNNNALSATIPNIDGLVDKTDRYMSYYFNTSYTYSGKYSLSASARYDASNLFGVNTNQKGTPLFSVGALWNINKEDFYSWENLSLLRLKLTYGSSGNIDKSISAYTTAAYSGQYRITGLPYAVIINPPNPSLRWERIKMANAALELQSRNRLITANLEYYLKYGEDIIGTTPMPSSSGVSTFRGNSARTAGRGIEFTLNTRQVDGRFKWYSDVLFSWVTDKVSQYYNNVTSVNSFLNYTAGVPTEGKPLFALYSLPWAGLDPQTGDPQGYLEGELSTNYSSIINTIKQEDLIYNGPARPTKFGSFRNTLMYKGLSLSANITYRLGYFFRNPSIVYGNNYGLLSKHGDYSKRWKSPGDENLTHIPSLPASANSSRDFFYAFSEVLVEKGDHVRLQDIRLSYSPPLAKLKALQNSSIYFYVQNLGILWKATSTHWDPDYVTSFSNRAQQLVPQPLSISIGFNVNF